MLIDGIYTPVITPFQEDGTVDSVAYGEQLEYLVAMGVDCIVVGGTTGESYAQTLAERAELMKLTADVIGRRLPLMAGVGSTRTEDSISLALVARSVGSGPYFLPHHRMRYRRTRRMLSTLSALTALESCPSCSTTIPNEPVRTWVQSI